MAAPLPPGFAMCEAHQRPRCLSYQAGRGRGWGTFLVCSDCVATKESRLLANKRLSSKELNVVPVELGDSEPEYRNPHEAGVPPVAIDTVELWYINDQEEDEEEHEERLKQVIHCNADLGSFYPTEIINDPTIPSGFRVRMTMCPRPMLEEAERRSTAALHEAVASVSVVGGPELGDIGALAVEQCLIVKELAAKKALVQTQEAEVKRLDSELNYPAPRFDVTTYRKVGYFDLIGSVGHHLVPNLVAYCRYIVRLKPTTSEPHQPAVVYREEDAAVLFHAV